MATFFHLFAFAWAGAIIASPTPLDGSIRNADIARDVARYPALLTSIDSADNHLNTRAEGDEPSEPVDFKPVKADIPSNVLEQFVSMDTSLRTDLAHPDPSKPEENEPEDYVQVIDKHWNIFIHAIPDAPLDGQQMDLAVLDVQFKLVAQKDQYLKEKITSNPRLGSIYANVYPLGTGPKIAQRIVSRLLEAMQNYIDYNNIYCRIGYVISKDLNMVIGGSISSSNAIKASVNTATPSNSILNGLQNFAFQLDDRHKVGIVAQLDEGLDGLYIDLALLDVQSQLLKDTWAPLTEKVKSQQGYILAEISPLPLSKAGLLTHAEASGLLELVHERIDQAYLYYNMKFVITQDKMPVVGGSVKFSELDNDAGNTAAANATDIPSELSGDFPVTGNVLGLPEESQGVGTDERRSYDFITGEYRVKIVARPDVQIRSLVLDLAILGFQYQMHKAPDVVLDHLIAYTLKPQNTYVAIAASDGSAPDQLTYRQVSAIMESLLKFIDENGIWYAQRFWISKGGKNIASGLISPKPPPRSLLGGADSPATGDVTTF